MKDIVTLLNEHGATQEVCYRVLLTPALAREFLGRMRTNRSVRASRVNSYLSQARCDDWGYTGQPIIFNTKQLMMDGQHRCAMMLSLGKLDQDAAIEVLVVLNVDDAAFRYLDQGLSRSPGDNLQASGMTTKSHSKIASAAALIWREQNGWPGVARRGVTIDVVSEHPKLVEYLPWASTLNSLLPASVAIYAAYRMRCNDDPVAGDFMRSLASGGNLDTGSPILILRNRLMQNSNTKSKLPKDEILALLIKAWDKVQSGKTLKSLRWRSNERSSGGHAEPFPSWPTSALNGSTRA